jgi:hypothetical protein
MGHNAVMTFDPTGKLVRTEHAIEAGNDGIVILPDGTKYVSSVRFGQRLSATPQSICEIVRCRHSQRCPNGLRPEAEATHHSDEQQ